MGYPQDIIATITFGPAFITTALCIYMILIDIDKDQKDVKNIFFSDVSIF